MSKEIPQPFLRPDEGGGGASVVKRNGNGRLPGSKADRTALRHIFRSNTMSPEDRNAVVEAVRNESSINGQISEIQHVEQELVLAQPLQNGSSVEDPKKKPDTSQMFSPQKPEIKLSMLDRENVGNTELVGHALDYWFGPYWRVIAHYSNPESDEFLLREFEKEEQFVERFEEAGLPQNIKLERLDHYRRTREAASKKLFRKAKGKVNRHLERRVDENYQPTGSSPREYFERMADSSNAAHRRVTETLFSNFPGIVSQLNEVELQLGSPARIIEYIARDDVDPDLKHELQKQLVRTYIAAEIESRDRLERTRERTRHLYELVDSHVTGGKMGETDQVWVTSFHDNRTKSCTYINDVSGPPKRRVLGSHKMSTPLRVRQLKDFDYPVYVNARVKDLADAGVKAIRKPIRDRLDENGDAVFNPREDVQDTMGMKFALLEGEGAATEFRDYLEKLFLFSSESQRVVALRDEFDEPMFEEPDYEEDGSPILDDDGDPVTWDRITNLKGEEFLVRRKKYKGRVMKIIDDSKPNPKNKNSNGIDFHRLQVYFSDTDAYADIQIQPLTAFLDSEYEVGEMKQEKVVTGEETRIRPRPTGQSHDVYAVDRLRAVRSKFVNGNRQLINLTDEEDKTVRTTARRIKHQRLGKVT